MHVAHAARTRTRASSDQQTRTLRGTAVICKQTPPAETTRARLHRDVSHSEIALQCFVGCGNCSVKKTAREQLFAAQHVDKYH